MIACSCMLDLLSMVANIISYLFKWFRQTPQFCYVADIPLIEPASSADLSQISADLNLGI